MNELFIAIIIIIIVVAIIALAIVQFLATSTIKTIMHDHLEATKVLDSTNNNIQNRVDSLSNNFETQMVELRGLQQQLLVEQHQTADTFNRFQAIITMKPTAKGRVGEGLIKWVLSQLPQGTWDEQSKVEGGIIDFNIHLNDKSDLYLDSKFSFPSDMITNDDYAFTNPKIVASLNKQTIQRAKELSKYNTPKNNKSLGFVMMYMPSVIYVNLSPDTINRLYSQQIIPVDLSGLLSNVLLLRRLIQVAKFDTIQQNILSLIEGINPLFNNMTMIHAKTKSQLNNAHNNLKKLGDELNNSKDHIMNQIDIISKYKA